MGFCRFTVSHQLCDLRYPRKSFIPHFRIIEIIVMFWMLVQHIMPLVKISVKFLTIWHLRLLHHRKQLLELIWVYSVRPCIRFCRRLRTSWRLQRFLILSGWKLVIPYPLLSAFILLFQIITTFSLHFQLMIFLKSSKICLKSFLKSLTRYFAAKAAQPSVKESHNLSMSGMLV